MPDNGRILYAIEEGHWVFRLEGGIRYSLAHPFDAFLEQVFAASQPVGVVADLREIEAIDSTGIGLLAKLARIARQRGAPRPLLFCGNPDVTEILDSVCLDKVFTLLDGDPDVAALQPLPPTAPSEAELAGTIAHAHRLLIELSESNRARFEPVVTAFERYRAEGGID